VAPAPDAREKILLAFAERAGRTGIRGVVMADLAADLGMSKKTLYQHFESKDALVLALVEQWTERTRTASRAAVGAEPDPHALLRGWAERWTQNLARFSPEFWRELERDQPRAHALLRETQLEGRKRIRAYVAKHLRAGVRDDLAAEIFGLLVAHFRDPRVCERLGMTQRDAMVAAIDLWAEGALRDAHARRGRAREATPSDTDR
jgi:AcrR family transcriptional regulator